MGHSASPAAESGPAGFADTVQTLPPAPDAAADGRARPVAGEPDAGAETDGAADVASDLATDIGLDLGSEVAADPAGLSEQPTLSHIGRYALKSLIGEGGLGRVYEAWDPLLSRAVAVKTLQFDLDTPSRTALDRLLLNEARAAAGLNHAHIVTVFDAGLSAHGVYIAMERLHGRDLRQALAGGWRPKPVVAAQIVRRVADALAYAHGRGVVHCDIKPANIFLARKHRPKVLDFGIARAASTTALAGAREATVAGSPHYLAPEQLCGGAIDARTDLHALGTVLYELLTGCKAFPGDSLAAIHAAVLEGPPRPAHEVCPAVPPALAAIAARAMARDPADRYPNAAELALALRRWAGQAAADAPAPRPPGHARRQARRRIGTLGALATLAAAVAAWGALDLDPAVPEAATVATAPAPPAALAELAALHGQPGPPAWDAAPPAGATAIAAESAASAAAEPAIALASEASGRRATRAAAMTPTTSTASTTATPAGARPAATAGAAARATAKSATTGRTGPRTAAAAGAAEPPPPAPPTTGTVQLAVSPWGEVVVNGQSAGTTPPLTRLTLPAGAHQITVRNADFTPYTVTVDVQGERPVTVRHRFGS